MGVPAAGCSVSDGLVGGVCASGYADCQDQCIPVLTDPRNCGSCGHVCASGSCVDGTCAGLVDGRAEGSTDGHTGPRHDGGRRDGFAGDGTASDGPLGDQWQPDGRRKLRDGEVPEGSTHDGARDTTHGDRVGVDAPRHDGNVVDVTRHDSTGADSTSHDSTSVDGPPPVDASGDVCAPPYVTADNCGACGVVCGYSEGYYQVCAPPAADAGADGGAYSCVATCPPPYVDCNATCVDQSTDPMNCGACGTVCPLGLCVNSSCAGTKPGEIVVIGHDYATANVNVSEAQILSNAVFLPPTNPLVVLSFEQYAVPAQVTNVKSVLQAAATSSGRTLVLVPVTDYTAVPGFLTSLPFAVVLVYDQPNAPAGQLAAVGGAWEESIGTYLTAGGDVVVLDGASGVDEMPELLSASGLLQTSTDVAIPPGKALFVVAQNDAVGNFVTSPYPAQSNTAYFITTEPNGGDVTFVVDRFVDIGPVPVVVHKIVPP
jgi:hypothetical protein